MYTDITSFDTAIAATDVTKEQYDQVAAALENTPEWFRKAMAATMRTTIIAKAINGPWQPDYSNYSEYKYFPWFIASNPKEEGAPLGFSYGDFGCGIAGSDVGARLVFESIEKAKYAGTQFTEEYRELMLP